MRCRDRQFGNWPTTRSVNDTRDSSSPVWRHRARPAQDRRINKDQGRESTPPSGSFFDWKRVWADFRAFQSVAERIELVSLARYTSSISGHTIGMVALGNSQTAG